MQIGRNPIIKIVTGAVLAMSLLYLGCLEQIDLKAPSGTEQALVIQGSVRKGVPSVVRVEISRLFDFTANTVQPVNVRSVEVEDEQGVIVLIPEIALGVHSIDIPAGFPDFEIAFGKSYRLHVEARDGRRYTTSYEPLHEVPEAGTLKSGVIQVDIVNELGEFDKRDKLAITIDTDIALAGSEEKAHLKWDIERTYKVTDTPILATDSAKVCYITENVVGTSLTVLNGNDFVTDAVVDFPIFESQITSFYGEGAYITVYQQSLSAGAYDYWYQITQLVDRTGNMFEAPAGKLTTNLQNVDNPDDEVFGYFYAFAEDTTRIFIEPESFSSPRPLCPPPGGILTQGGTCAAPLCCDCLSANNSTTLKPEFWTE